MWEIFAYHNSEALEGIFNAIAAIMASGTYLSAIAAVGFCGFVAAMVAYMFQPEKLVGWKWLVSVVLIYGVPFVPHYSIPGLFVGPGGVEVNATRLEAQGAIPSVHPLWKRDWTVEAKLQAE